MHSAVFAVVRCPSVSLPIRYPHVGVDYCIETVELTIKLLQSPGSAVILVFLQKI